MSTKAYINKYPKLSSAQDFAKLRQKGIEYIQRFGRETWTDHNIHDPGITILEVVCYAITELGFKADFSIEELLAETTPIDEKLKNTKQNHDTSRNQSYFNASEILNANPLTIRDWRRVIIDVPMIKNAWFVPIKQTKPEVYVKNEKLAYGLELGSEKSAGQSTKADHKQLSLNGLFDINLEFELHPELGELNSWQYQFELTSSGFKPVTVYIRPNWQVFLNNNLKVEDFTKAYFETLDAIDDKRGNISLYVTNLVLVKQTDKGELAIKIAINIFSPLKRNDTNKDFIDSQLISEIDSLCDFVKARIKACIEVAMSVAERVHAHRNLCEDLHLINHTEQEEIGICADIEVTPDTDLSDVMAQLHLKLDHFLAPPIHFYSAQQLLERGLDSEAIYNGPNLTSGYTLAEEIDAADYKQAVYASDIIQLVMDIPGIVAISNLQLSRFFNGQSLSSGEAWCLQVNKQRSLRFSWPHSNISFYKGMLPYKAPINETLSKLNDLLAIAQTGRLPINLMPQAQNPTTELKNKTLGQYHSIQHDFPLVYGIGNEGVSRAETALRKAQAKQLKGFLSLIDQVLANFTSQLSHVKHLFSLDSRIQKTYFSQKLFSLPESYELTEATMSHLLSHNVAPETVDKLSAISSSKGYSLSDFEALLNQHLTAQELIDYRKTIIDFAKLPAIEMANTPAVNKLVKDFVEKLSAAQINQDSKADIDSAWTDFKLALKHDYWHKLCEHEPLLESNKTYQQRRNRFLDHLLARFAEQFSDYVLLNTSIEHNHHSEQLINSKISLLKEYPEISRNRAKGFNHQLASPEQLKHQITGLEHRGARLLGINQWQKLRFTAPLFEIFEKFDEQDNDGITEWRFRLRDENNHILLSSVKHYEVSKALEAAMEEALIHGNSKANYELRLSKNNRFYFVLKNPSGEIIAINRKFESDNEICQQRIDHSISVITDFALRKEGFHLVEHLLLRPINKQSELFKISLEDCSPGYLDPYSFRATIVVPGWLPLSQNTSYRQHFETTLRSEAPAHIHLKICWVNKKTMTDFENHYFDWLRAKVQPHYTLDQLLHLNTELIDKQNKLIASLQNLNSIYRETRLFDCQREGDKQSILLNHSKLGSTKGQ